MMLAGYGDAYSGIMTLGEPWDIMWVRKEAGKSSDQILHDRVSLGSSTHLHMDPNGVFIVAVLIRCKLHRHLFADAWHDFPLK